MCLLSVAWRVHPDYPLVFVGNRDEYHARPTRAADWWDDFPDILGGRDLVAGGSWLGVNRDGRFAVVTNRPDLPAPAENALSRGELVNTWLIDADTALTSDLQTKSRQFGGFSLLLGDSSQLTRLTGGNGLAELAVTRLSNGVTGLSNTAPDDPWPKLTWLNQQLAQQLAAGEPDTGELMQLLQTAHPVPGAQGQGVAALPFITGESYGTRSCTVITLDKEGECCFTEHSFGPGGQAIGEATYRFHMRP